MAAQTFAGKGLVLQDLPAKEKQDLISIEELLERLFVRNRRQHRQSHWFKSLLDFRKQLHVLLDLLAHGKTAAAATMLEELLKFLDKGRIHQWYLSFTQIVAVGPFAVLGLVLMASVARVCRITGITTAYEESASDDVKGVMTAIDDGRVAVEFGGLLEEEDFAWDEGEVVEREE